MTTEEYIQLWKDAIHLCEVETNKQEAESFIMQYYDGGTSKFCSMDDRTLLVTFVGLVVYEQKFKVKMGSTTPTSACFYQLLQRSYHNNFEREFILDVGDWAAEYSDNEYVPMGNCRGYGPRRFFEFQTELSARIQSEQTAKQERLRLRHEAGEKKVEAAKERHQQRLSDVQKLMEKDVDEVISDIEQSGKSAFYYKETIQLLVDGEKISKENKKRLLALFPEKSTKHNNKFRKQIEEL